MSHGQTAGAEQIARQDLRISRAALREVLHLSTWTDVIAMASFLAPVVVEGVGFLRILRLLRTYHLLERLRQDSRIGLPRFCGQSGDVAEQGLDWQF